VLASDHPFCGGRAANNVNVPSVGLIKVFWFWTVAGRLYHMPQNELPASQNPGFSPPRTCDLVYLISERLNKDNTPKLVKCQVCKLSLLGELLFREVIRSQKLPFSGTNFWLWSERQGPNFEVCWRLFFWIQPYSFSWFNISLCFSYVLWKSYFVFVWPFCCILPCLFVSSLFVSFMFVNLLNPLKQTMLGFYRISFDLISKGKMVIRMM